MTRRFDRLAYREPRPSAAVMHALGFVNRRLLLPHVLRFSALDFPAADLARLRSVVGPGSAAFLAPNHPEFMTDWLLDKEISRLVSPHMAHWASYEVVNAHPVTQWIWLRNNLIANAPGGSGKDYSVRWARAGHGVLLHPEGGPTWHADRVAPLVPGVIEMAWETHRQGGGPVHVAPIVWKLHFRGDASTALHREMAHVERALGFASGDGQPLGKRFASLQKAVLARSLARHGAPRADAIADGEFFALQAAHAERLLADLESRSGATTGDRARRLHGLRRAIHEGAAHDPAAARRDRRTLAEIVRLGHFTREHYAGPALTQEQIAESLKQTRLALVTRGCRESLHGLVPVAVAPRIARIRVPEPIAVHAAAGAGGDEEVARRGLLQTLRDRLQSALDRLNAEIALAGERRAIANPFHGGE